MAVSLSVSSWRRLFYGEEAEYSYYAGCSTDGRQNLKPVQMFPDDVEAYLLVLVLDGPATNRTGILGLPPTTCLIMPVTMDRTPSFQTPIDTKNKDNSKLSRGRSKYRPSKTGLELGTKNPSTYPTRLTITSFDFLFR
jgi:hypothetical protein